MFIICANCAIEFAVIYGTVFNDTNGNGEQDYGEAGIPGVTVTLDETTSVVTNESGQYTFTLEAAGIHTLVETDPAGYTSTTTNEVDVDVDLGHSYEADFGDKISPPPPQPPKRELDHIVISPDTASVTAGDTQTYTAEAFDQQNTSMGDVTSDTTFSIESGAGGRDIRQRQPETAPGVQPRAARSHAFVTILRHEDSG